MLHFNLLLAFFSLAQAQRNCGHAMDIMFLQDTTGSFIDDLPNIRKQLPRLVSAVLELHPGSSFGVAEFRDKPFFPLGNSDEFCYKLNPLGALSTSVSHLYFAYGSLLASGGGDIPEDVFQALINVALDPAVGWSPTERSSVAGSGSPRVVGNRLLFLVTDAPPHLPGDINKYNPEQYPELPQGLPPNSGSIVDGNVTHSCLSEDYPSPYQMEAVVKDAQLNIMFVTPDYANITATWTWVNEDLLGQPSFFYQKCKDDSSDFMQAVMRVIAEFSKDCVTTSTETPTAGSGESVSQTVEPLTTLSEGESRITKSDGACYPCPPPCLPPCSPNACCSEDGLIIRVNDQPKEMILDVAF